ncbi:MAG: cell envelope biogenesis protein OmpA, partial [Pseudomonadota bacterium]
MVLVSAAPALAETVRLSSPDGGVTIEGSITGFDGQFYRLVTTFGPLTVDAAGVTCSGDGCPDPQDLAVTLAMTGPPSIVDRLLPELVEVFARREGLVLAQTVGQDGALRYDLARADAPDVPVAHFLLGVSAPSDARGVVTQIDVTRAAPPSDAELGTRRADILALDALVPVVSADAAATMVSRRALAQALAGRINTWETLTGEDVALSLHLGDVDNGTMQEVERQVLAPFGWRLADNATRHTAPDALVDAVAEDAFALGVTTLSELGATVPLVLTGPCGYPTVASPIALKTEDYPLTKPVYLIAPVLEAPGLAGSFLRFVRSPDAQPVIAFTGFVDQRIARVPFAVQGGRLSNAILASSDAAALGELQRMMEALKNASRLSVTYRFEAGSSRLDAASRSNVGLLADAIARGEFD